MGKKFYETPEFKEISKEWEEILKEVGLPDIEKQLGKTVGLKQYSSKAYRQMDPVRKQTKEVYFQQLGKCLHSACFDCAVDRVVMVLRARGSSIIEICQGLLELGMSRHRGTVRLIIRKYENIWGIRQWKPEQLKWQWYRKRKARLATR